MIKPRGDGRSLKFSDNCCRSWQLTRSMDTGCRSPSAIGSSTCAAFSVISPLFSFSQLSF